MGTVTKISWTDHTHSPWWGCTKVSPGCDSCYAEAFDKRVGGAHWGAGVERRRIGEKTRQEPFKWNAKAQKEARRHRVFCASMSDVFDNQVPSEWRDELWATIRSTPWLIWQLLTKRPQNIARMLPPDWEYGYFNVWLGTTTENQTELDRRWPHLVAIPSSVRFLSCEPLLGRITLPQTGPAPDWVIIGGESGGHARPMEPVWAADLIEQARRIGAAPFFKQAGSNRKSGWDVTGKGDDPAQWPSQFNVQEFP